ncbi:uncharacterized protein V1518DRAFT_413620 [Limtongia smithiae]|uniref:uncharacterized protein n=1 Tax=Limtongia smithiae TaxID=1125753 RepID=UPI0034CFCA14
MSTLTVVGATGLVGSQFVALARSTALPNITAITALSRHPIESAAESVVPFTNTVTQDLLASLPSTTKILFSGLGTTKGTAGSFEKQYDIDYRLNLEIAKAAKAAGASTYVIVSASTASADSRIAYSRMKGELDRDVSALGFDTTIILRPGLILGERTENRPAERIFMKLFYGLEKVPVIGGMLANVGNKAEDIAKAALVTIQNGEKGVHIIDPENINKLAKEFK